jgi:4-nitrophenyl phosphatase
MASLIDKYRAFIIDLDGVVYLLNEPIPGAREVITRIQEEALPFVFLTNNSASTPEQYVKKLAKFGIGIEPQHIVTSSHAVGRYLDLNRETVGRAAFVIGETGLIYELEARGLKLVETDEARGASFVFVGMDRMFDFEKLKAAVVAIRNGAEFIAANADTTYPTPDGLWPGAGSIVAAVATGSGQEPYVAGKPNTLMVDVSLERMGARTGETLLIGDRLETDILAGVDAGVDTMLLLTGISRVEEIEERCIRPTYIGADLQALTEP